MSQLELLAIVSTFRSCLASVDPLGHAFTETGRSAIGDVSLKRNLLIGSVLWNDRVTLTFQPLGIDTYRIRLSWHAVISIGVRSASSGLDLLAMTDVGTTEIEMSAALVKLRNEIEHRHIMFAKALLDSVSGHEPVVVK
jgi:hypothetical protein